MTYSCLFKALLFPLVFMHLHFTKVNLPEQTVQLLFIAPVAIENQRYETQQKQSTSRDACRDFASIIYKKGTRVEESIEEDKLFSTY